MREIAEQAIGWLVPAGIICAIFLARRRYKGKYQADIAAAEARGEANALAAVSAQQHVNVAVDASNRAAGDHQCLDPFTCSVCAPALLRVVRAYRGVGAAGGAAGSLGYHDDIDYHDDSRADDYGRVVVGRRGIFGAEHGEHSGHPAGVGGDLDRAGDSGGVEGVSVPYRLAPGTVNDIIARPWAYAESDPRFERGVPVARGRGGRGPGR